MPPMTTQVLPVGSTKSRFQRVEVLKGARFMDKKLERRESPGSRNCEAVRDVY